MARKSEMSRPTAVAGRLAVLLLFVLVQAACAPAEQMIPVAGHLTPLFGEGPPSGYISGEIPDSYRGLRNPYSLADQEALKMGQRIYLGGIGDLSCVRCHGGQGRGNGPKVPSLDMVPSDFTAPPMLTAFRQHQDYVFWWVSEGLEKTVMPAFKDVLSETQRWQVITYAWYLGEQESTTVR